MTWRRSDFRFPKQPAARGFTLIEVVVSLAVLAVVLVSVFRMQAGDLGVVQALAFDCRAVMLARAKIAELDASGIGSETEQSGDYGQEAPGCRWKVTIGDREDELLGETAERLKIIDIRIDLNQDERVFTLRTQRLLAP